MAQEDFKVLKVCECSEQQHPIISSIGNGRSALCSLCLDEDKVHE